MTIPFAKLSPPACTHPSRLLLSFVVFIAVALAGPARLAYAAEYEWQGTYSTGRHPGGATILLTLPAGEKPGEIRFDAESCSVGLKALSANTYTIVQRARGEDPGPYCTNWLDGHLVTRQVDGGTRLGITVTKGTLQIDTALERMRGK